MAYSTLVSLERTIDQILDRDQFSISLHERKQIISLHKCVISLQSFLENFPGKAKNLEAKIRDVAAEAEDTIEWFMLEQIRYSSIYTKWIARARRIRSRDQLGKVSDKMDSIIRVVAYMENYISVKDAQLEDSCGTGSLSQVVDTGETVMVDSNEDLVEIKAHLCGELPQLQVLPIFGMGGIGKTTLARNAYSDPLIMEHFEIRAWVTVSQDYNTRRILLDLLDSMKEFNPERISEQNDDCDLAVRVHKILTRRRFLIVMDDMWSKKVFDDVKKLFPNDNNGSRIMLTTRLTEVATYANSSIPCHEMRLMDSDQSWTLLRRKVFAHQDHITSELENIGREIARSCGGLPLAITVIAGVLSTVSKTLTSWNEIAKCVKQFLSTTDGQIEKILSLSYSHLPLHLRPCFLYMAAFPEDHEIKVTDLTRLWIAEGFVKPVVSKSFEDTAEEYLEDLVKGSLIIIKKREYNGKIKYCSLHDMVRDMCIKLSQEEKFLLHVKGGLLKSMEDQRSKGGLLKSMEDQRRISISHSYQYSFANTFNSTIRTILFFHGKLNCAFRSFRLLRVLDVRNAYLTTSPLIPDEIFELFHLRYLAFEHFLSIPRAISNLQSLQTLIIQGDWIELPCEIWNMPKLRHLICGTNSSFPDPKATTSALENLQTLQICYFRWSFSISNMIPNLKKLSLVCNFSYKDTLFYDLIYLRLLEELHLEQGYDGNHHRPVVFNLFAHISLKKLTLIGWGHNEKYMNIAGPFPNLQVLKLKRFNFMQQEWRTSGEDFPQLKYLLIDDSNLRQWSVEGSHFPRLRQLMIRSCPDVSEIPDGIGEIPTLELIELKKCRKSLADSTKQIQEDAQDYGNDVFQLRCIHCNVE